MVRPLTLLLILIFLAGPALWAVVAYHTLKRLRAYCVESWLGTRVELGKRYELIHLLLPALKPIAHKEKSLIKRLIKTRQTAMATDGCPSVKAMPENMFVACIRETMHLVNRYPELSASREFSRAQEKFAAAEERIQAAREFHNLNVRSYNLKVATFPSSLVAAITKFEREELFDVDDTGVKPPAMV